MADKKDTRLNEQEQVEAMMTWIKRGQVTDADKALAEDQLARSPDLAKDLALEEELIDAFADVADDEDAEARASSDAAWENFKTRLEAQEGGDALPQMRSTQLQAAGEGRASAWRRFRLPQTSMGWLATAQTAALAAMAFILIPGQSPDQPGNYETLSSGGEAEVSLGNAVLVVAPSTSADDLNTALLAAQARIVDGPMANGGYVIAIEGERLDESLESLRARDDVVLAEALDQEEQP